MIESSKRPWCFTGALRKPLGGCLLWLGSTASRATWNSCGCPATPISQSRQNNGLLSTCFRCRGMTPLCSSAEKHFLFSCILRQESFGVGFGACHGAPSQNTGTCGKGGRETTRENIPRVSGVAAAFPRLPKKAVLSSAVRLWTAQVALGET